MRIISEIISKIIQNNAFYVCSIGQFSAWKHLYFFIFGGRLPLGYILEFYPKHILINHLVGNKAKGRISKPVFQENKARQVFRKKPIPYPLIRTPAFGLNTER